MHLPRALLAALFLFAPALRAADGSLEFSPASQQRVEVPGFAGLGISTEVTVEFWALSTSSSIAQSVFMLNPDTATNRFQSHLNYFNGNTYWDFGDIGAGGRVQLASQAGWLNNWTHFALVASQTGNTMKIYANGVLVASPTGFNDLDLTELTTQAAKLSIGGIPGTYFAGKIDDFRIWNVARSAADIRQNMSGPLTGSESGLRLYFKFDEGTGTTAVNSAAATGAAFNGTLMGTTTTGMWSAPARTTYAVTTTNDTGAGSLRQAITDAAAASGPALITFAPALSGQTITLTDADSNSTAIDINDAGGVTIDATSLPGGLTINDGTATTFRLFSVASGTSLTLRGLTLANGGGAGLGGFGGAIFNEGTLTLTQCSLSGNSAIYGGAIFNSATLTLTQCSLSGNSATGEGGAIRNFGTLTLTHCTLSGNSATSDGGAINNFGGTLALSHCTISGNSANGTGGGIYNQHTLTLTNSIVAGNVANSTPHSGDIRNLKVGPTTTYTRIGSNIVQLVSNIGTVTESGDPAINANPLLAPLASNGGPTKTMALLPGSPAIDAATVIAGLDTDQRGLPRNRDGNATAGAAPDIGAYEAQVAPFSVGFNFVGGRSGVAGGTLASGDIAGVPAVAQGNWNNLTTDFAGSHAGTYTNGPTPALAADGSAFSPNLRLWWDASATYTSSGTAPTPATPPDERLMFGYLDSNNSGDGRAATNLRTNATGQPYFAVAGLPAAATLGGYRVLVYADGDAANSASPRKSEYWLTTFRQTDTSNVASEVPLTPSLFIGDTANFSGTYTRGTGTSDATATAGANYVQFDGLTEPGGFMVRAEESGFRAPINAVQIVRNEIIVVTTTADENDPVGTAGTGLSLREAVALAPDGAGIVFDSALSGQTITLNSTLGDIVLAKSLTIDASSVPGGLTIDGGSGTNRIFFVDSGQTVALKNLTLTGGNGTGTFVNGNGGAIYNQGTLTLTQCTLSGNSASTFGGAIYNSGTLTLTQCTLSSNSAQIGGAIFNNLGTLTLTQCTLSGNSASSFGGAIFHGGTLTLTQCTLSGNSATHDGGAIFNDIFGTLMLTNTIAAGNNASRGADVYNYLSSTYTRNGANIVQTVLNDGTTTVNGTGTVISAAPLLAPLGNYGGPTLTMPPLAGSPAIDAAVSSTATTDQRGAPLRDGDGNGTALADIGAVEFQRVIVTTAADENDTPAGALLSLREALRDDASGSTPAELIAFAPGLSGSPIVLGSEIVIANSVAIDAGSIAGGVTIDGGTGTNRIFTVNNGTTVALLNLALTGGNGSGGGGGAILNNGALSLTSCRLSDNSGTSAGAINNNNILTLTRCSLSGNSATNFGGGAIGNSWSLTLTQCSLTGNTGVTFGGAIDSDIVGSTLVLTHCTLSGNSTGNSGGAIDFDAGTATLTHCTLAGNSAGTTGGAIRQAGGSLTLINSIVAGNTAGTAPDIRRNSGTLTNGGGNLIGRNNTVTTEFPASALVGTSATPLDAKLAPLGDYGGPTQTMALLPGSPARNAAVDSTATSDQRGFPIIGTADIGAYEAGTFTNYNAFIWESLPTAGNGTITDPLHASTHDYDGDGQTNGDEWIARTDPGSAASYHRVTQTALSGSTLNVTFPTVLGRTYQLQSSPNLANPWTNVGSPTAGTGGNVTLPVNITGQTSYFFRVSVQ